MIKFLRAIVTLFAVLHLCVADEETKARLLVSKQILNRYLVEHCDILVRYSIFNVGNGAATDIRLTDNGFHTDAFVVVGGEPNIYIKRLNSQANYTHVVVVRPKSYGYYNFTAAEISYKPMEDAAELKVSMSSEPGEGGIVNLSEFNKSFSSHFFDWLAFCVMTLPSLIIPYMLWHSSKAKYERHGKNKKFFSFLY